MTYPQRDPAAGAWVGAIACVLVIVALCWSCHRGEFGQGNERRMEVRR